MQPASVSTVLRADHTIWCVVNAVNVLQAIGFLSRIPDRNTTVNHVIGYFIIALAVPAAWALAVFVRSAPGLLQCAGPTVFLVFVTLMAIVDYLYPIEFRSPPQPAILAPYLITFFGAIVLMGLPIFRQNRRLWLVTVATSVFLLAAMVAAMRKGVG